ncbi:hypothetical protein VTN49DRAFT_2724 [Thermomyces lanuginosus]|uniref:uncharacterized protein n=1 Tax=Thermomyces lanuginosus TaxID=5541 RepID=UPI0037449C1B
MAEHKQRRHEDIVLTHGYAPRLMPPIELDPQTQVVDDQQDLTQPKIESANVAGRLTKKNDRNMNLEYQRMDNLYGAPRHLRWAHSLNFRHGSSQRHWISDKPRPAKVAVRQHLSTSLSHR